MKLSPWAIESIEEQIKARGEATHYEPMRRETFLGRTLVTDRLTAFNIMAMRSGYCITRSDTTGGIVIKKTEAVAAVEPGGSS